MRDNYKKAFRNEYNKAKKQQIKQRHDSMLKDKNHRSAYRFIKGGSSPPLLFLKRDKPGPQKQAVGTYTTHPDEIDQIVKRAYDGIYAGNIEGDPLTHANAFITKYKKFIYTAEPFRVGEITGTILMEDCTSGPFTSGGLDGFSPHDFSCLSLRAFDCLATLLNAIEDGLDWPEEQVRNAAPILFWGTYERTTNYGQKGRMD